jgi:hypothetical protein
MDAWTRILDLVSQLVTPVWNELIQYIPLLLLLLLGLVLAVVAWSWQRNAALNRPSLARVAASGQAPPGIHLPGPSIWPFIVPIGLFLLFLSVVFGSPTTPFNMALLALGLVIAVVGGVGWFLQAWHEYNHLEAADEHLLLVEETEGAAIAAGPPAGIHLPGPSAWPFLAPIGLFFVFLGVILSPILIVGGLVMGAIAALGWWADAGREYRDVEAGQHPEPVTRNPEQAFPKRLMPLYFAVGAVAVLLTLAPWLLSLLPGTAPPAEGPAPTSTPTLSASQATAFDQRLLVVVADQPVQLTFDNRQAGVPHDVAIATTTDPPIQLFKGEQITGPDQVVYAIDPLPAGEYRFTCTIHPPMVGRLVSR